MSYRVEITRAAQKGLSALPAEVQHRVVARIDSLADEPRGHGAEALKGELEGLHKLRLGEYRVIVHIDDANRTVGVLRTGHRRNVYR